MFEAYTTADAVRDCLLSKKDYRPFPDYEDRAAWDAVPAEYRERYLSPAARERILSYEPKALTATAYLQFYRSGGESGDNWSPLVSSRREILLDAVLAECLEGKGAFLDKIIDLVWLICEESSWVVPPHNNHMHNHMWSGVMKNALPDVENLNFIDLFSASCAADVGWVYYFLKKPLDAVSPLICRRIEYEIERRIVTPFMTHDDLTWFGFYGHKINNWNPWILENILPVCLFTMRDEEKRCAFLARALEKFDIYVNNCTKDGACDEGPGYWNVAGGAMLDVIGIIRDATGGRIDKFRAPLSVRTCEYIASANMSGDLYANFADAGMSNRYSCALLWYAKQCGSAYLERFARSRADAKLCPPVAAWYPYRGLNLMFAFSSLTAETAEEPFRHRDIWYPDGQLLFVRSRDEQTALSAKGGYNNESHNHNDAGSFIYMTNGEDVICDPGALNYTARAFSPYRYEFWIVNSDAHNCVTVGGHSQKNGDIYRARELSHTLDEDRVSLSLALEGTYDADAGVLSHTRTFDFDKTTGTLTLTDDIRTREPADADVHFLTRCPVTLSEHAAELRTADGAVVTVSCCDHSCGGVPSLEYHYNIRREKEHYRTDSPTDGEKRSEVTRIVFSFPENRTERTVVTRISATRRTEKQ